MWEASLQEKGEVMKDYKNYLKEYLITAVNTILMYFFAGSYYEIVGWALVLLSSLAVLFFKENKIGRHIILWQIKEYPPQILNSAESNNAVLLSVAFLMLSMKIGAALAVFVEAGTVVIFMLVFLIAWGWFFEGSKSGMTIGAAYGMSKFAVKIYLFLDSWADRIAMFIVKVEFRILKIDYLLQEE